MIDFLDVGKRIIAKTIFLKFKKKIILTWSFRYVMPHNFSHEAEDGRRQKGTKFVSDLCGGVCQFKILSEVSMPRVTVKHASLIKPT